MGGDSASPHMGAPGLPGPSIHGTHPAYSSPALSCGAGWAADVGGSKVPPLGYLLHQQPWGPAWLHHTGEARQGLQNMAATGGYGHCPLGPCPGGVCRALRSPTCHIIWLKSRITRRVAGRERTSATHEKVAFWGRILPELGNGRLSHCGPPRDHKQVFRMVAAAAVHEEVLTTRGLRG